MGDNTIKVSIANSLKTGQLELKILFEKREFGLRVSMDRSGDETYTGKSRGFQYKIGIFAARIV
eukprot:snap_masked-scaffold_3-processed-gene-2.6-mRNA-1 protein AED:1.00 eAED:1.00 QI:0/-1/0/0/-1/1/1/0/63